MVPLFVTVNPVAWNLTQLVASHITVTSEEIVKSSSISFTDSIVVSSEIVSAFIFAVNKKKIIML